MRRSIAATGLIALLWAAPCARAETAPHAVAVTFDDLPCPPADGDTPERQVAINRAIVAALTAALELWLDAGLELGNHAYSHPSLHDAPLADWLADAARGEPVTHDLLERRGRKLRWFRHPYLHTGRDLETRRAVEGFLAARGMRVAPVTLDNSEWVFARAYLRADQRGDARERERLAQAYVAYLEAKIEYFERQSAALFGREIPQVLLLHGNRLNAAHFPRVVDMLMRRGYRFIALEQALEDPAYASPDTFTGRGGISWVHRWALSRGGPSTVLPDEPATPAWILAAAGVDSE